MKVKKNQLRELVKLKMLETLQELQTPQADKAWKLLAQKLKVDVEQLKMGVKTEYEHTDKFIVAAKIALDHLREIPDYYTRLTKMEKGAGVQENQTQWEKDKKKDDEEKEKASQAVSKSLNKPIGKQTRKSFWKNMEKNLKPTNETSSTASAGAQGSPGAEIATPKAFKKVKWDKDKLPRPA